MNNHESDVRCVNCGYTYGEHRWGDDACPITAEQNYPAKFVEGSLFMPVKKDEGRAEETEVLECLLEKIEDGSSDLWDVEVSDLDGSACVVLNTARAKESIIEYAESYHQRKLKDAGER